MSYWEKPSFVFALQRNRILQHGLFWLAVTLYLLGGFRNSFESLGSSLKHTLLYLPGHAFMVYCFLYFLIPKYILKRKLLWFLIWMFPVMIISALYIRFIDTTAYTSAEVFADPRIFQHAVFAILNVCGIAVAIKLMKYWYLENEAKQQAERASLTSQLELLKSQVHPHFLFNTLNNLYSLTLEQSKEAPSVVLDLSSLLRYMLYECDANRVPLGKEIDILNNYIKLEKIRYGERLDISVNYNGDFRNKMIAPLLLLPFLENSFKHGTSEQIDQCWISLHIDVSGDTFDMKLINSRIPSSLTAVRGIGLENVRKRLDLLYHEAYSLKIIPDEEIFTVSLQIILNN